MTSSEQQNAEIESLLTMFIKRWEDVPQVRVVFILEDIKGILAKIKNKPATTTQLEDVQQLYTQKH